MELYEKVSYAISRELTNAYSTSFSLSMRLFSPSIRTHIYAIYGMVRIADEIVDSYSGADQRELLDTLEKEVKAAVKRGYSTNPIIHAYALTAHRFSIPNSFVTAFFKSMRMDLQVQTYDQTKYETYIYGSAEVVGLMCLKVFTDDEALYLQLEDGARHLGAAYQKVNFIRDIKADHETLGRWYFPFSSFMTFDDKVRGRIIKDIEKDFVLAKRAAAQLPETSRRAVELSITYYSTLLEKIKKSPASRLKTHRIRINNAHKMSLFIKVGTSRREA
ncbi:MAG: phytoene/squalene synthase family protein [Candidatus Saccharimonadales bacterium]